MNGFCLVAWNHHLFFRFLWLVLMLLPLCFTGCSTVATIRPAYKPSAASKPSPASRSISLRVVDKIDNQAPLAEQVKGMKRAAMIGALGPLGVGALVSHTIDTGQLLVSDAGPYKLDESPVLVSQRILKDALDRSGVRVANDAPDVLEMQLLRFEFVLGTKRGEAQVKSIANVLLSATLQRGGQVLAETAVLEQGEQKFGWAMTPGEIEGFVSETLSRAMERTLGDEKLRTALNELGTK